MLPVHLKGVRRARLPRLIDRQRVLGPILSRHIDRQRVLGPILSRHIDRQRVLGPILSRHIDHQRVLGPKVCHSGLGTPRRGEIRI